MQSYFKDTVLLSSNETDSFARRVYDHLCVRLKFGGGELPEFGHIRGGYFPAKEIYVQIDTNIRGKNVFCFHGMCGYKGEFDPNVGLVKLVLIDSSLRNSSPERIRHIVPFMPYQRQDRVDRPRVPISAKTVLNMIGIDPKGIRYELLTYDMHTNQAQGFADNMHIENIPVEKLFYEHMVREFGLNEGEDFDEQRTDQYNQILQQKVVIISPDAGGKERIDGFVRRSGCDRAIIDKTRRGPGESEVSYVLGAEKVKGRKALILDDMIDTAGTLEASADALRDAGATGVYEFATHGIFSTDKRDRRAEDKIRKSGTKCVITDAIPRSDDYLEENKDWIKVLSLDKMTAEAIFESRHGGSYSTVFGTKKPSLPDEFVGPR